MTKFIKNITLNDKLTIGTECAVELGKCPVVRWCNVNGYAHKDSVKKPDTDLRGLCGCGNEYQNIELSIADLKRADEVKKQIIVFCKSCKHKQNAL
ncbi:MAG: hypothetical protein J6S57_02095 [Alphaproteobacteria bacterium]|nr:hypothetical protein [Alphaproteobacteria bacterium]